MTVSAALPQQLHYLLTRAVIETGHAPDLKQLAALAGRAEAETEQGLRELERMHGVILVPNSLTVWSLHPFALMPTRFWVTARPGGWWANCAWCSLAIGAALREDRMAWSSTCSQSRSLVSYSSRFSQHVWRMYPEPQKLRSDTAMTRIARSAGNRNGVRLRCRGELYATCRSWHQSILYRLIYIDSGGNVLATSGMQQQ